MLRDYRMLKFNGSAIQNPPKSFATSTEAKFSNLVESQKQLSVKFKLGSLPKLDSYGRIQLDITEIQSQKKGWQDLGIDSTQIFANDLDTSNLIDYPNFSREKVKILYSEILKLSLPNLRQKSGLSMKSIHAVDKNTIVVVQEDAEPKTGHFFDIYTC